MLQYLKTTISFSGVTLIEQHCDRAHYVQFALFQQFPELAHGSFNRNGGVSTFPFQGLNVSVSSGDTFENVLRNRYLALQSLQIENYPCATAWMIHSADVLRFDGGDWDDWRTDWPYRSYRSEEHTSELQSRLHLVCRLLLEKKKQRLQQGKVVE